MTNVQPDIDNSTVNNLEKNSENDCESNCESDCDKTHVQIDCNKFNTIIVYQEVKVSKSKNQT